jgi:hypothetical protein
MRRTLAFIVVVGLPVGIAAAYDRPPRPSAVTPDEDARLAKVADAPPHKIGVLTYYRNKGGGYTFIDGKQIVFYALSFVPATCQCERIVQILGSNKGQVEARNIVGQIDVPIIGLSPMPVGSQTIYRGEMHTYFNLRLRHDLAIGKWVRDTPDAKARLSITSDDHETRLKLKSIVPVLDRGR